MFSVDDEKKSIRFGGRPLELSRTEYRLLKVLVERPGRVFSRDELMSALGTIRQPRSTAPSMPT